MDATSAISSLKPADVVVSESDYRRVYELYDASMMMQAYEAARAIGPLERWQPTRAKIMVARLARNIGGGRFGHRLIRQAYQQEPTHPQARYYRAGDLIGRWGPFAGWEFMRGVDDLHDADATTRADWLALRAEIAWCFRDFDAAESFIDRASEIDPTSPWICVMRARMFEAQDRYDDALLAARRALELRPWSRDGAGMTAHVLQLLDRDDEALDLLSQTAPKLECGATWWQLAALQINLEKYDDARDSLDQFEKLVPLLEHDGVKGLAAFRSEVSYHRGQIDLAIQFAKQSENKFLLNAAEHLAAAAPDAKRVCLKVPFVRQHHMTCAPATLAAISRFWSMPSDHLAVVEAICYDGTPSHSERRWANEHGWVTREFTVTWESAVALIDRGVPFTLATTEATSAHLQAAIGYDARRGTILVRDPYRYYQGEFHAEPMLKRYAATGPRGMALVPAAEAHRLDGLDLPDSDLYDLLFGLLGALERHDRASGWSAWEAMNARSPDHRLTMLGRRSLAGYDGDHATNLEMVQRLLEKYPDDGNLRYARLALLRALGRRDERLGLLREIVRKSPCDPSFQQELAGELADDAREHPRAIRQLRKVLRRMPQSGQTLHGLAGIYWSQQDRQRAIELYRFTACCDDKNETAASSYFIASRHLRKADEATAFLRARFDRFGSRSSFPARTLCWALESRDRVGEAMAVLDEAQQRRPADGDLTLHAANVHARHGGMEKARSLLASAEGKTHRMNWLRASATLASYAANLPEALEMWKQVLEAQPLAMDAHNAVAHLTAETDSPAAAQAHLQSACARFPHFFPLAQLRVSWLRSEGAEASEPVVRALVEQRPDDAWARRELALVLNALRRHEEALAEAAMGLKLEPSAPSSHYIQGVVLAGQNRLDEAQECWRQAIRLSVDFEVAITELVNSFHGLPDRREALRFIRSELIRQVIFGDGLLAYRDMAQDTLAPAELLDELKEALAARPDLWHAWSAVIAQQASMDQLDEALGIAKQATEKFALIPRVWLDLASVCRTRGDRRGEIDALNECLRITPGWSVASRQLAGALMREGDLRRARRAIKDAIARDPLDASNYGMLSELLWRMNKRRAAIVRAKQAVLLEPGLQGAWDALRRWTEIVGKPEEAVELARTLTRRRAGEARSWLVLASMLGGEATLKERLEACDKALTLNPRSIDASDLKATFLCEARRFDDALAACQPAAFEHAPTRLAGRAAWVRAERGEKRQAIEQMTALLQTEPSYYWGWQILCGWHGNSKDNDAYLRTAREMAKNFPNDLGTLNGLGDAQIRADDRAGGKATLSRVLAMSPANEYAGFRLFDAQLQDSDTDAAAQTLQLLFKHHEGPWARQREIALSAKRKDQESAAKQLAQLAIRAADAPDALDTAIKNIDDAMMPALVDRVLGDLVESGSADKTAARAWINRLAAARKWRKCNQTLRTLEARRPIWLAAMAAYINALAAAKRGDKIRRAMRKHGKAIKPDTSTWATLGYGLLRTATAPYHYKLAANWMSDYAPRTDAGAWTLANLALALRAIGRDRQAYVVSEKALTLPPDQTTPRHIVWMALDELIAQQPGQGIARWAEVIESELPGTVKYRAKLAKVLMDFDAAIRQSRESAIAAAKKALKATAKGDASFARSKELRRTHQLVVRRIARTAGGWKMRLWAFFQS